MKNTVSTKQNICYRGCYSDTLQYKPSIFFAIDFSSIGLGCVVFQMLDKGKLDINSNVFKVFNTSEQTLCTTYRESIVIL